MIAVHAQMLPGVHDPLPALLEVADNQSWQARAGPSSLHHQGCTLLCLHIQTALSAQPPPSFRVLAMGDEPTPLVTLLCPWPGSWALWSSGP